MPCLVQQLAEPDLPGAPATWLKALEGADMTIVSRRILPLATVIAVTAMLSILATAGAAHLQTRHHSDNIWHFTVRATSERFIVNGATNKNPAGAQYVENAKLVQGSHRIGTAYVVGTIIGRSGRSLQNIAAVFPGKGELELQGINTNGLGASVITGGTGVFGGVTGEAVGHNSKITLTFS